MSDDLRERTLHAVVRATVGSTGRRRDVMRLVAAGGLLLMAVALVWIAANDAPARAYMTGLWPIGLGTAAVLTAPVRARVPVSLTVGAIAALGLVTSDLPARLAIGYAPLAAIEVYVVASILRRGDGRRPELRTDGDLRRYFMAAIVGGALGAVGAAITSAATGYAEPGRAALGVGIAHLSSHLVVVPIFMRLPLQGAIAGPGERRLQWLTVLVAMPLTLMSDASPSLTFLVVPVLAWAALRITPVEAMVQLLGVVSVAIALTSFDRGPFIDVAERYDLPGEFRGILLSAFCATLAVIVVPLVLRVGEYVGAATSAAAERDLVRGIVDGARGIAIVGTDPHGRITLFNPGAETLLGYRAEEVLGRRTTMLHTPQAVREKAAELGVAESVVAVARAVMERRLVGTPIRMLRKDGVERTHATTLSRLTVNGVTSGFISTSEDITDQLDTEQALRDALAQEQRAMERMREVDAVKNQFVSTVSHELRTPITSILGYLEVLADGTLGDLGDAQLDALLRVQSNSHRLLALIDDLLTLSRFAERGLLSREEAFDLRDAVRSAYDVVAPSWDGCRRLEVALALPERSVPAYGDRDLVERLVVNLVGNAVKFTDDGGAVDVTVHVDDAAQRAVLRVSDTGIGIPEDEQEQLFTRFFRSSLAEGRAIPGSGLGLSIAQAVVEQHGGSIEVTSRVGEGTTIEVRLPIRPGMSKIQLPLSP